MLSNRVEYYIYKIHFDQWIFIKTAEPAVIIVFYVSASSLGFRYAQNSIDPILFKVMILILLALALHNEGSIFIFQF